MSAVVSGDLEAYGFDEVEPGIVEDSMPNRRRIKLLGDGDWDWERITDEDGELTNLIRVLTPAVVTERRIQVAKRRAPIMVDPENPWSDYVHPDEYPLDVDLPWWVEQRLIKWRHDGEQGIAEEDRRPFPTRCTQLRMDNTRCWLWVNKSAEHTKCSQHRRETRQAIERHPAYARMRLLEAAPFAVDNIIYLAEHADGEAVRLKANTEILDRSGVTSKTEVDISATVLSVDPGEALKGRLEMLRKRNAVTVTEDEDEPRALPAGPAADVVDGELVDEASERDA